VYIAISTDWQEVFSPDIIGYQYKLSFIDILEYLHHQRGERLELAKISDDLQSVFFMLYQISVIDIYFVSNQIPSELISNKEMKNP